MAITLNGTTGITTPAIDNQGNLTVSGALNATGLSASTSGLLTVPSGASIYTVGSGTFGLNVAGELTIASGRDNGGDTIVKTSNAERMRIDGAGRVTMPYQPAFHVYASTASVFTSLSKNLSLNNVEWNIGSHFSTANYRFTCPVAGLYYFYTSMNINSGSNPRRTAVGKNGVIRLSSYFHTTASDWIEANTSGTILCNANDYIEFYYQGTVDVGVEWHYAGGYLIG